MYIKYSSKKKKNCPNYFIFFLMKDVLTIKNTNKKQKEVHVSSNVVEVNKKVLFFKT